MENDNHLFDFSEYSIDHKCYDVKNKKVYGNFKYELKGKVMTQFCCLKPKMHSFEYIKKFIFKDNKKYKENKIMKDRIKNKNKHKGIKKSVDIYHNDYKKCLYNEEILYKEFYNLQLNKQNIYIWIKLIKFH